MSLKKRVTSGFFWTMFQEIGVSGIGIIISILLARIISPSEFGLIGMLSIFNAVGTTIVFSGMGLSLIRTNNISNEDYSTVFFINLLFGLFLYLIIFIISPYVSNFYEEPVLTNLLRYFSLVVPISSLSAVQNAKLTKEMRFRLQATIQIPSLIIGGCIALIMGYIGYGVWALATQLIITNALTTLQFWLKSGWHPSFIFNVSKAKKHFNFGSKLLMNGLLDNIFNNIYPLIIGKYYSAAQVGFYSRAQNLKNLPIQSLINSITKVTYPALSELRNNPEKLSIIFTRMVKVLLIISSTLSLLLILVAEPLFLFLLTEKWAQAIPYFQLLMISGIFSPILFYNKNLIQVIGRSDLILRIGILNKIITVIIILSIYKFGVYSLIIGFLISFFFELALVIFFTKKVMEYSIKSQIISFSKITFPSLIVFLILFYFKGTYTIPLNNFFEIISLSIVFIISNLILQYLINKSTFIELVSLINNYLPTKFNLKL